jgi:hypothetical protein
VAVEEVVPVAVVDIASFGHLADCKGTFTACNHPCIVKTVTVSMINV